MMKLLLDEQMPRKIKREFPTEFRVDTVQENGWSGVKNGELLQLAAQHLYDALISADQNMAYQQRSEPPPLLVLILKVPRLRVEVLASLIPAVLERLRSSTRAEFFEIG